MINSKSSKKSALVFVISNIWQCRIYKKVIHGIYDKKRPVIIIGLRSNINNKSFWDDINETPLYHINVSSAFDLNKLSFIKSLIDLSSIRNELKTLISKIPHTHINNGISFVSDDLFRIHELTALSLFRDIKEILCLQHGLRTKNNNLKNKIKEPLTKQLRFFLFCNLFRILSGNLKKIILNKKCIYFSVFERTNVNNKKFICSGNLAVESSVIDLKALNKNKNKNLLFMGSGAFRYNNNLDKNLAYKAILYAIKLFENHGYKKLYFKFKPDEDIKFLKDKLKNNKNVIFLSNSYDLFESIKSSSPELIMCTNGSTVVAELFLSGYKNISYQTNFEGYDNFYSDMYLLCGIKVQNLNITNLEVTDPSNVEINIKLKNLIGYKDGGIKLVADILN